MMTFWVMFVCFRSLGLRSSSGQWFHVDSSLFCSRRVGFGLNEFSTQTNSKPKTKTKMKNDKFDLEMRKDILKQIDIGNGEVVSKNDRLNLKSESQYLELLNPILSEPIKAKEKTKYIEKDRPYTLPPGNFKPKQSLGQNFLSDQNYVRKICSSVKLSDSDGENGSRLVEIGPGAGALTRVLFPRFPRMTAIELDQRSVSFLESKLVGLSLLHRNVLEVDWPALAREKGGRLSVVANLPYNIVSQILFSFADSHKCFETTILTMQLEVAERLCASPRSKEYGIPSVVFQLYCRNPAPRLLFKIPPTVFYPVPKVDSALQRRKMLRQSLKKLFDSRSRTSSSSSSTSADSSVEREFPAKWARLRPEELSPEQFIELTLDLCGPLDEQKEGTDALATDSGDCFKTQHVWRSVRI